METNITINGERDAWLFESMLDRPDRNNETGKEYLIKNNIIPSKNKVPDVYIAKEGFWSMNPRVPKSKTIFMRIEDPCIMPTTYSSGVTNGFMAVLTQGTFAENSYHFTEPQDYRWFDKFFYSKKECFLCMLSRNINPKCPEYDHTKNRKLRIQAVDFFDKKLGRSFHTYGSGWGNTEFKGLVMPYNKKFEIISKYKFNIAFEGQLFNGRITEKVFQAMICGSIPIYLGPDNIDDYIPSDCYVDFRDKNFEKLYKTIVEMSEEEINQYKDRIKNFLYSIKGDIFSSVILAKVIEKIIRTHYNVG